MVYIVFTYIKKKAKNKGKEEIDDLLDDELKCGT